MFEKYMYVIDNYIGNEFSYDFEVWKGLGVIGLVCLKI